ncbi:MAG: hypothetical protein ACKVOE_03910 [Rickettsiales bacterium]
MDPLTNLAIRPPILPRVPPHVAPMRVPAAANDARMGTVVAGGEKLHDEAQALHRPPQLSAEDLAQQKKLDRLNTASAAFEAPLTMEGIGFVGGGVLGGAAGMLKWTRGKAGIQSALMGPVQALRETRLNNVFLLPAKFMESVAGFASGAGGKAQAWASPAAARAEKLTVKATKRSARLSEKAAPIFSWGGNVLDRFAETSVGGKVQNWVGSSSARRLESVSRNHDKIVAKTFDLATTEVNGVFTKLKNLVTGTKAATGLAVPSELHTVMGELKIAHGLTGAKARAEGFAKAAQELQKVMQNTKLEGQAAGVAGKLATQLERAATSAMAVHSYQGAANGTLRMAAKTALQSVGRVPLFGAIVGVGVAFGIGAKVVSHNIEKKRTKATYDAIVAAAGGNANSPYVQNILKASHGEGRTGIMKTVSGIASEGMNAVWGLVPHGGGPALMAGQFAPMAMDMLATSDPTLAAFNLLDAHAKGTAPAPDDKRIEAYRHLIAPRPEAAAKGGFYANMSRPVAEEFLKKNLSPQAAIALLTDDARYDAFLREMTDAAKAQTGNDNETGQVNSHPNIGPKAAVDMAQKAERPQLQLGQERQHHGRIEHAQLGHAAG